MLFPGIKGGAFGIALRVVNTVASAYSSTSASKSTATSTQTSANKSSVPAISTPSKPTPSAPAPTIPAAKKDTATISSSAYSLQSKNSASKNVQQTDINIKNINLREIKITPLEIDLSGLNKSMAGFNKSMAGFNQSMAGFNQSMSHANQTLSRANQSIATFTQGVQGVSQATGHLNKTADAAYKAAVQANTTLSNVGNVNIHKTVPSEKTTVSAPTKRPGDTNQIASSMIDLVPVVGNIKAAQEAITGKNLVTNQPLSPVERTVAMAGVIGGPLVKVIDKVVGIGQTAITAEKITKDVSEINKAVDIANNYKLSDDRYYNHILMNHGPSSTMANKSKFNVGFDIKQGIDQTLKSPDMYMKENTNGRSGYVFYKDFDTTIGKSNGNDVNRLRVATDASGNVLTAFPEKNKK